METEAHENCYCPMPASTDVVHVHTPLDSQPIPFTIFVFLHALRRLGGGGEGEHHIQMN